MLTEKSAVHHRYDVEIYLHPVIYLVSDFFMTETYGFFIYNLYTFKTIGFDSSVTNML